MFFVSVRVFRFGSVECSSLGEESTGYNGNSGDAQVGSPCAYRSEEFWSLELHVQQTKRLLVKCFFAAFEREIA
jgi:hypothetical protein